MDLLILKGLEAEILELRILKDLRRFLNDLEIDCKGVSKRNKDKFTQLRILKDLRARSAEVKILNRLGVCG